MVRLTQKYRKGHFSRVQHCWTLNKVKADRQLKENLMAVAKVCQDFV